MIPAHRKPTHPGEILLEEFLEPMGLTQLELAHRMGVPVQRVNTLINGKRDMTAETAILLGRVLKTTPELWMNLQDACDLYDARARLAHAGSR
ncbi:MAG: HigA family addiction module antidote protein [Candidatus Omnitrophica bacterium]|nr:HigA family addiction module antidote protein [Candidatus Omnitrophota bacterium]